jgi:hypothetical protein
MMFSILQVKLVSLVPLHQKLLVGMTAGVEEEDMILGENEAEEGMIIVAATLMCV